MVASHSKLLQWPFLPSELRHVHRQRSAAADQLSGRAAALGESPPQTHPEEAPDVGSCHRGTEHVSRNGTAFLSASFPPAVAQEFTSYVAASRSHQDAVR